MTTPKQVTVVIAAGTTVYRDGVSYGAGQQVKVSAAEAKQMLAAGYVEQG